MKKTLAIVLALAMVLCMIPAAFAANATQTITDGAYNLKAYSVAKDGSVSAIPGASATKANSLTVKYDFEKLASVTTGKFTEDKKMILVDVADFAEFKSVESVTVDGKDLQVNSNAVYQSQIGYNTRLKNKRRSCPRRLMAPLA